MYQIPTFHVHIHIMSVQATRCTYCRHTSNHINGVSLKKRSFFYWHGWRNSFNCFTLQCFLNLDRNLCHTLFLSQVFVMGSNDILLEGGGGGGVGEVYTIIDNSSLPTSALELQCCFNNVLFWMHDEAGPFAFTYISRFCMRVPVKNLQMKMVSKKVRKAC